ncbi:hypothetical protein JKJ11_25605 [Vibrio sp. SCSIO 43133]|uniref:3TM-type holin n=1 Tax=Vibrio sp. SCSIO 43133 TaxID=2802577 RepID=UPI0020758518|nr:3TM-type holin [Vibrio sp. SCSIO 43133]USE03013.1 hypothetical protein JKJ11_25605 [Vibrio sp. SCSIO 43133]
MWSQIWGFVTGNAASIVEQVESAVDDYFYTDEEKSRDSVSAQKNRTKFKAQMAAITSQLAQNEQRFKVQLEQLIAEREKQIHDTYQREISASKDVIVAELHQSDLYTKRARPTVIYAGLLFVFLELLGLRVALLSHLEASSVVIESSTAILSAFLYMWGTVAGAYALGRSAEKRGISNSVTRLVTGASKAQSDNSAKTLEQRVKEQITW